MIGSGDWHGVRISLAVSHVPDILRPSIRKVLFKRMRVEALARVESRSSHAAAAACRPLYHWRSALVTGDTAAAWPHQYRRLTRGDHSDSRNVDGSDRRAT